MWREQVVITAYDLSCCLMPLCEALRACLTGSPITTVACTITFVQLKRQRISGASAKRFQFLVPSLQQSHKNARAVEAKISVSVKQTNSLFNLNTFVASKSHSCALDFCHCCFQGHGRCSTWSHRPIPRVTRRSASTRTTPVWTLVCSALYRKELSVIHRRLVVPQSLETSRRATPKQVWKGAFL